MTEERKKLPLLRAAGRAILLVEDDWNIRTLEAEILREVGCQVIEVGSADEALSCLERSSVALLVTDIRLPGSLDGIALACRVRQVLPQLKILMVGADADFLPDQGGGIADRTLRKPFSPAELEHCVAELIGE